MTLVEVDNLRNFPIPLQRIFARVYTTNFRIRVPNEEHELGLEGLKLQRTLGTYYTVTLPDFVFMTLQ